MKTIFSRSHILKSIGFIVLLFSSILLKAQSGHTDKWKFRAQVLAGLLEGSSGSGFQAQAIGGVQHKSWFLGLGAGLDDYKFRGVPLFLDLRKSFYRPGGSFFLYGDGGIHFVWPRDKDDLFFGKDQFKNGWYYDLGLGYSFHVFAHADLQVSAGYSYKYVGDQSQNEAISPDGTSYQDKMRYDFDLHRLSLKIGIAF